MGLGGSSSRGSPWPGGRRKGKETGREHETPAWPHRYGGEDKVERYNGSEPNNPCFVQVYGEKTRPCFAVRERPRRGLRRAPRMNRVGVESGRQFRGTVLLRACLTSTL